jgi:hypothetical protein
MKESDSLHPSDIVIPQVLCSNFDSFDRLYPGVRKFLDVDFDSFDRLYPGVRKFLEIDQKEKENN